MLVLLVFICISCGENKLGEGYAIDTYPEYGTAIILAKSDTVLDPKYFKYYNKGSFIKFHFGNKIDTSFAGKVLLLFRLMLLMYVLIVLLFWLIKNHLIAFGGLIK